MQHESSGEGTSVEPEPSVSDSWLPAMPELPSVPSLADIGLSLPDIDISSLVGAFPKEFSFTAGAATKHIPSGATIVEQEANSLGRADQQMPVGASVALRSYPDMCSE